MRVPVKIDSDVLIGWLHDKVAAAEEQLDDATAIYDRAQLCGRISACHDTIAAIKEFVKRKGGK